MGCKSIETSTLLLLTSLFLHEASLQSPPAPNAAWLWPQQQSTETPTAREKGDLESEIIEGRGYFTFVDYSTTASSTAPPTTPTNCVCVPYYLCDDGQYVDATLIDLRQNPYCGSALEVCCKSPKPTSPPTSPAGPTLPPTVPSVTATPGFVPQCGTLNPNGVNARILGFKDGETQFGEYPWMGAVLESKWVGGKWVLQFLCGATLVTPRVLVTAAHCVKGKKSGALVIRLGEWDTHSTNEFYPHQDLRVGEVVAHPDYYGGGLYNDIALLFLRGSAVLSPHIDTACLPSGDYDNSSCWATGWGKNAFGPSGSYQAILREVNLGVTPPSVCQGALRKTSLGSKFSLHQSFLCAGGLKNLDTCVGDGGGPLVCPSTTDPWRYVLVGVVSWGVNCGNYGVPGVYVNVPKFRGWIDAEIGRRWAGWSPWRWTIEGSVKGGPPQGG